MTRQPRRRAPMTQAQKQARYRDRQRQKAALAALNIPTPDVVHHHAASPERSFLRGVLARTDALGKSAGPTDVRLALQAADLLAQSEDMPEAETTARELAVLLGVPIGTSIAQQSDRIERARSAVQWAQDLLQRGVAQAPDIRAGMAACSRLVRHRGSSSYRAVDIKMAMILSGATGEGPPAHLVVDDRSDDEFDDFADDERGE